MNTGHIFAKIAVLISCSMAFAVNGTQYYNLAVKSSTTTTGPAAGPAATQTKTLYLYQAAMACTVNQAYGEGTCVASVKDTPQNLADMLKKNWVDKKEYKTADLFLRSDIDLGELSTTGECVVNHVPLPTPKGIKMYFSNSTVRYTFKNLCYSSSDPMTGPVGLFESVDEVNMADPALKGVKIVVNGSSNGADYYPVGALVGQSNLTTIQNVLLQDVEIDAPMAGAVVGMLKSSTVKNSVYNDDIFVNNSVAIETGYAGSNSFEELTDHKVFLGGVAGVAIRPENDDASFDSVYVTVKVKNLAKGQKSALGGVAGLYSTIGESISRVNVINKINYGQQTTTTTTTGWGTTTWPGYGYPTYTTVPTDTIESVISGGSAMGGLFGVMTVFRQNNSPVPGNFSMKNSHFEGTITGASVSNGGAMAVGGLIGSDSLMAGMSVTIDGSSANSIIVDSVRASGKYSYHVGGLVGYGSAGACRNGSSAASSAEYLSITNSKTLGSIDLSGEASAAGESFHMQTFVGGIVGAACLSHDGNGLKTDSSSMTISVKSRNTVDAANNNRYDSLFVGGLAGYFNTGVAVPNALPVSKSVFTGSIAVDDSLNMAYIGGIVGGMMQRSDYSNGGNGHAIEFSGVKAENSGKLIDYKVTATTRPSTEALIANIGGICGLCDELYTLQLSNVIGSINVSGDFVGDSLLVGGLVGKAYASGVSYINVQKVFVNGDINVPALPEHVKVGYLVGSANFNRKIYTIKSAYHNGANDANVTKPFGNLLSNGIEVSDDWMTDANVSYVVRNGDAENLDATLFNGVKTVAQMQNDAFLAFLKEPFATEKNPGWNKIIGKNSNMPYVDGDNLGCAVGVLTVNFVDANNELVAQPSCVAKGDLVQTVDTTLVANLDSLHCSGWEVLNNGVKVAFDETKPITENTTIYAKYSLNSYKVVFKKSVGDNGLVLAGPYVKEHGSSVDVPTDYSAKYDSVGYHFVGWHDTVAIKYVNSNLEIIALYEPDMSIYTYLDKDGNFFDADTVLGNGARRDVAAPVVNNTEKNKYEFDAWYAVESEEFPGNVFQAKYIESLIDYYITFKTVGGTLIQVDTLHYGDAIAYPADPEMEGFKFTGWNPKPATVTGDTTIVAYFEAIPSKDPVEEPDTTKPVEPSVAIVSDSAFLHTGSAFKLGYGIKGLDTNAVTTAKLVVSLNGEVIIDSVMADDVMESFKSDWELIDAAAGDYTIQVIVQNGEWVDSSYKQNYTVDSVYTVAAKNWQMVALSALDVDANGWSNGGVLYWWDETTPIGEYWQYRSFQGESADPTRGYWFGSSKGNTLTVRANASKNVEDVVWNLDNIYSGWNMVANPYGWAIDLSKADDNGAGVTYYKWLPAEGTYGPATEIGPYEAVWAKLTKGSSAKVTVPAAPCYASKEETSVGKKVAALRKALRKTSSKSWSVVATLSDENGRTDFMNVIGAGDKEDSMDEPPAGMGDRVNLSVMDGKNALAKSVKAVANEYEWTFSVAASSAREGKLEFEGVEDLNALGLHLYVTVDGVTTEVKAGEAVGVALTKTSKEVGVRVASSVKAVAVTNRISGFRMGQSSGMLQMQFDASSDLAGTTARYALVGVNGKRIASGSFTASAGSNVMNVSAPKTGIYYMHLKVGSQMSSAKVMVK